MFFAFQSGPQLPTELVTKAGTTIIDSGVLGALLVLSVIANAALVIFLFRVQNKRVLESSKVATVAEKMVMTFDKVDGTLEDLTEASKTQATTMQMFIAVMSASGRSSPSPALPPPRKGRT